MISVTRKDRNYRILLNPAIIAKIEKDEEAGHRCYTYCDCDPDTKITLIDGESFLVEESINTIEARLQKESNDNHQS